MFRPVAFCLLVLAIVVTSNATTLYLDDSVVPTYRRAFSLLLSGIVNKLLNANMNDMERSSSNLPYELYCAVEEVQLKLREAIRANGMLRSQVRVRVNELVGSISRLEQQRAQVERRVIELNSNVEQARANVRYEKQNMETARKRFFSQTTDWAREARDSRGRSARDSAVFQHTARDGFSSDDSPRSRVPRCYMPFEGSSEHREREHAIRAASTHLENEQRKLEDTIGQQNNTQSLLTLLNKTLHQQQTMKATVSVLAEHFAVIRNQLKAMSYGSKRLIDLLMDVLDDKTMGKPLRSIYDKLLDEYMIEPNDSKLSEEVMKKSKQHLRSISAKLPQFQYRRQQFRQPCAFRVAKSLSNGTRTEFTGTGQEGFPDNVTMRPIPSD